MSDEAEAIRYQISHGNLGIPLFEEPDMDQDLNQMLQDLHLLRGGDDIGNGESA